MERQATITFKDYDEIALWQVSYIVGRLGSDIVPTLRGATVKTGCAEIDALLNTSLAKDLQVCCKSPDKRRVKPVVWVCVECKRPSKLEVMSAMQLHKTSDVVHEDVERLRADATPQTVAFFYIIYWRTRSPITVKYFVDHLDTLNVLDHPSMIQYFLDTYNCPSLTQEGILTRLSYQSWR